MQVPKILPSRVVISYVFDYFIIIFLIIAFSALDKAEPFHQRFSLENKSLQYPFADPERIPPWLAGLVSCAFPLAVIILWTLVIDGLFSHQKSASARRGYARRGVYTMKERLWEMNAGILGLGLSVAAVITITGALKNLTGKPRPDVIDRCQPDPKWVEPKVGLTSWTVCTGDPHILKDGFKSWPSGHSSTAFAGLGYLSIYLSGKLHILDNRGEVWKTVLVLIPLLAASMVAVSRIMDARHHPFDVISSSILGILFAWISYRQYFPSLRETRNKGRAYPIRSWGRDPTDPTPDDNNAEFLRSTDEEEGKSGYSSKINRALASGLPEDGAMVDAAGQRRRQYLEDQEMLERRRRRTHEFYDAYTGPTQSPPTLPPGAPLTSQPTAYHSTASHDSDLEDVDTYEMRDRKSTKSSSTAYNPYGAGSTIGQPHRHNTQSTDDSQESDDRKWGIATATNAIGGQGGLVFTPIQEEFSNGKSGYGRKGTGGSDERFIQVNSGSRGVELRDDSPVSRGI